jgi:soluble lytic murein transglycosylase
LRPRRSWLLLPLVLLPPLLLPGAAAARDPIYRFVDARGVIHFTNIPSADERFHPVALAPTSTRKQSWKAEELPDHHGYDALILRWARAYSVEPALVKAVIAAESNFEPRAISRVGAQGLMQLMPETARTLGVREPFEPEQNVAAGARYLRAMLDRYGDLRRALAAYNAGPTAVDQHRGVPPYRETRAYVDRVLTYYRGYHDDFRRSSRAVAVPPARRGGG